MLEAYEEMARQDILESCGRVQNVLTTAHAENATTKDEHGALLRMPEFDALLMNAMRNPLGVSTTGPYMSMLESLKEAADAKVITPAQLKNLVERLKASEREWKLRIMTQSEMRANQYMDMINKKFPEYMYDEAVQGAVLPCPG